MYIHSQVEGMRFVRVVVVVVIITMNNTCGIIGFYRTFSKVLKWQLPLLIFLSLPALPPPPHLALSVSITSPLYPLWPAPHPMGWDIKWRPKFYKIHSVSMCDVLMYFWLHSAPFLCIIKICWSWSIKIGFIIYLLLTTTNLKCMGDCFSNSMNSENKIWILCANFLKMSHGEWWVGIHLCFLRYWHVTSDENRIFAVIITKAIKLHR